MTIPPKLAIYWASISRSNFFNEFPIGSYLWGSHLDWQKGSSIVILKGTQLVTIPLKFDINWASTSRPRKNSWISYRVLWLTKFGCGGQLGQGSELNAGHCFESRTLEYHFSKVWLKFEQQFQRGSFLNSSPFFYFLPCRHIYRRSGSEDTSLKKHHPRIISVKF